MNLRKYVQRPRNIWTFFYFFLKWKLGYSSQFFRIWADAIRFDKVSQYFISVSCKSALFGIQLQPSSVKALKDLVKPI